MVDEYEILLFLIVPGSRFSWIYHFLLFIYTELRSFISEYRNRFNPREVNKLTKFWMCFFLFLNLCIAYILNCLKGNRHIEEEERYYKA